MDFEDISVLDLFGGTGSISYECASRGCTDITYVEKFAPCTLFVKEIAQTLDIASDIRIIKSDVFKFLASNTRTYDLIFADPPYAMPALDKLPDVIFSSGALAESGMLVLEHGSQHTFKNHPGFKEDRKYGDSVFSFFE